MSSNLREYVLFISGESIGIIDPTSKGAGYLRPDVPRQERWQPGPVFSNGERMILWSQEDPVNPKADFGAKDSIAFARTHLWVYDLEGQQLKEIELPSLTMVSGLLPGEERILVTGNREGGMTLMTTDLHGEEREVIDTQPGYGYCTTLSPEGERAAYHITGVQGRNPYEIYVVDLGTGERLLIASDEDHLSFGPEWSPDGTRLLYQSCAFRSDPGHDRSDLWVVRSDGAGAKQLTEGHSHWFATSYGSPHTRGGGSNIPRWSPDGRAVTFTRLMPGSRTAWRYRTGQPDLDHFNREYRPDLARGGSEICLIDPDQGSTRVVRGAQSLVWNWRPEWSKDSSRLSFSRAPVGYPSELWVVGLGTNEATFLTRGIRAMGADFSRFVELREGLVEAGLGGGRT